MDKKTARLRRARRGRAKIRELGVVRLCVNRTPRHIYAQLIGPDGATVPWPPSSLLKDVREQVEATGNAETAVIVGRLIAERACRVRRASRALLSTVPVSSTTPRKALADVAPRGRA